MLAVNYVCLVLVCFCFFISDTIFSQSLQCDTLYVIPGVMETQLNKPLLVSAWQKSSFHNEVRDGRKKHTSAGIFVINSQRLQHLPSGPHFTQKATPDGLFNIKKFCFSWNEMVQEAHKTESLLLYLDPQDELNIKLVMPTSRMRRCLSDCGAVEG